LVSYHLISSYIVSYSEDKNGSAVCDPVSGEWQFAAGDVGVDQLYNVNCPARITGIFFYFLNLFSEKVIIFVGNFIGSGNITFGVCGKLAVTGASRITNTDINIDMAGLDTVVDNYYYPVLYDFHYYYPVLYDFHYYYPVLYDFHSLFIIYL
jgi:hypothetical protein